MPKLFPLNNRSLYITAHIIICILLTITLYITLYSYQYSVTINHYNKSIKVQKLIKERISLQSSYHKLTQNAQSKIHALPILLRLHINQHAPNLIQKTFLLSKQIKLYNIKLIKLKPIEPNTIKITMSAPFSQLITFIMHISHAPPLLWLQQASFKSSGKNNIILLTSTWNT